MRKRLKYLLILLLAASLLQGAMQVVRAVQNSTVGIGWWVWSAGGSPSIDGTVKLHATLGQPIAGAGSNATVQLNSGYWVFSGADTHSVYMPIIKK